VRARFEGFVLGFFLVFGFVLGLGRVWIRLGSPGKDVVCGGMFWKVSESLFVSG
jgi:hypothetical protein